MFQSVLALQDFNHPLEYVSAVILVRIHILDNVYKQVCFSFQWEFAAFSFEPHVAKNCSKT